jgi:hypothetical protein
MMIPQDVARLCTSLLEGRHGLLSLWQELADNFYPERAEFTITRFVGSEFVRNLMSSYPNPEELVPHGRY